MSITRSRMRTEATPARTMPKPPCRGALTTHAAEAAVPTSVRDHLNSPGRSLESTVRRDMEQRFGHDFSGVRVHTDAGAAASARAIDASAYAFGNHIVFGQGHYRPHAPDGQHLIAHELSHTLQQRHAKTRVSEATLGSPHDASEHEAERSAFAAMRGERPSIGSTQALSVRRQPAPTSTGSAPPPVAVPGPSPSDALLEGASPILASAVGSVTLSGFVTGHSELNAAQLRELRRTAHNIVVLLRRYPMSTLQVTGHADTVGGNESNRALGMQRAQAVRDVLVAEGVPESLPDVRSSGEEPPQMVHTRDNVNEPRNRAVEVRFYAVEGPAGLHSPATPGGGAQASAPRTDVRPPVSQPSAAQLPGSAAEAPSASDQWSLTAGIGGTGHTYLTRPGPTDPVREAVLQLVAAYTRQLHGENQRGLELQVPMQLQISLTTGQVSLASGLQLSYVIPFGNNHWQWAAFVQTLGGGAYSGSSGLSGQLQPAVGTQIAFQPLKWLQLNAQGSAGFTYQGSTGPTSFDYGGILNIQIMR
jgi:outer membrane protein OmpA-like peptidoglycan-associated protein